MLTRGQVAKRLGVSIAAVRAFEGERLHPRLSGGRWLFKEREVDSLAALRLRGGGRLTSPFAARDGAHHAPVGSDEGLGSQQPSGREREQRELREELIALRKTVAAQEARLEAMGAESSAAVLNDLKRELAALSPRQLRSVLQECPELLALIDE